MRRGGRARFKAHAWNACKLERVSGVRIPPSPPTQSAMSEIFRPELRIDARVRGQFRIKGDQRFATVFSSAADFAGFSLCRNASVPIAPCTFQRARWFAANGRRSRCQLETSLSSGAQWLAGLEVGRPCHRGDRLLKLRGRLDPLTSDALERFGNLADISR
jgi:hypothetical protein